MTNYLSGVPSAKPPVRTREIKSYKLQSFLLDTPTTNFIRSHR
jgi:hypothetical protein